VTIDGLEVLNFSCSELAHEVYCYFLYTRGRRAITSIAEMTRNTEVERGDPEQQMFRNIEMERGDSEQEMVRNTEVERGDSEEQMARNTEVERGAAEQQMTTYQRANSYQDDTVKNAT
jgi:hypothetical protein